MSNANQPRRPAGTPIGGQWAPSRHDEPDLPQITRSAGVPVGRTGFVVGGATDELDGKVQEAATALAKRFETNVEIRFNSDHESGGAWLVTHPESDELGANTWVGIGANENGGMYVYLNGEALRDPYLVEADRDGQRRFVQDANDLDSAISLIAEKSIAGDKAEIERRKSGQGRLRPS